jgi:hypothetical protein
MNGNQLDSFNMTTVNALLDNKFRDTLTNNIFNPSKGKYIYAQGKRVFSKAAMDSILIGGNSGFDINIVKFWSIIYSNDYLAKQRLLLSLRHESAPNYNNMHDSICIGWKINSDRINGFQIVGILRERNSTTWYAWIEDLSKGSAIKVDWNSISKATTKEKQQFGW